jgi:hypothetical protein
MERTFVARLVVRGFNSSSPWFERPLKVSEATIEQVGILMRNGLRPGPSCAAQVDGVALAAGLRFT